MEGAAPFAIATGVSAAPFLERLVARAREKCGAVRGTVYPIQNDFFGHTITVAGLVTGGDLIAQLRGRDLGRRLLIPANMLRAGERVFWMTSRWTMWAGAGGPGDPGGPGRL